MQEINTVLVVGAGVMGHGFAQVFALNGIDVFLVDQSQILLDRAQGWIRENLEFMVELELIKSPEIEAALNRIRFTSDLNGSAAKADYVLEAITEDLELKKSLFKQLGKVAGPDVILATNTSSYDINKWVAENFPSVSCHHEYDCCGNWYPNSGQFVGEEWSEACIVAQSYTLNV